MASLLSSNGLLTFLLVIGGLIFVHELGHFLAARRTGVRVEEFGIGFPPRLLGAARDSAGRWHLFWFNNRPDRRRATGPDPEGLSLPRPAGPRLGTVYSLNLLPLGGFVRPAGEDDPGVAGGLAAASKRARLLVLSAGVLMNLLAAAAIFAVGFKLGWPDRVGIAAVVAGTPAEAAGLQVGDVILSAGGVEIHDPGQLVNQTHRHLGQPMSLSLQRGEGYLQVTLTPRTEYPSGQGPMGIEMQPLLVQNYTWPQALVRGTQEVGYQLRQIATLPGRIASGELPLAVARPVGLVGIYDLTGQAVDAVQVTDQWFYLIQLVGAISVALAITNLLPLPALDGGRIVFVLLEAVRGRRISPEREGFVHAMGFLVLLALMLLINGQELLALLQKAQ